MTTNVNLATLNPTQGVIVNGTYRNDGSAYYYYVSGAGDVNKDGYADVIIGVPATNNYTGEVYVVYGSATLNSTINLANLSTQGIYIYGTTINSWSGYSVSDVGDFNGDGYADIVIGAPEYFFKYYYTPCSTGTSYIIYGSSSLANINLDSLTNSQGLSIIGAANSCSGFSVSGAGDVNGDGYDDIIIGAPGCSPWQCFTPGVSYVIYGSASNPGTIMLATLNTAQGFEVSGAQLTSENGLSVSGIGDINKNGYSDIITSAPFENSLYSVFYVIYGRAIFPLTININSLGTQGITIEAPYIDYLTPSVSGAGDINNDSYADFIIGITATDSYSVGTYLIYGNQTLSSTINLADLGTQGIAISGASYGGWSESVSGAGDVNGDGYDGIIIGAPVYYNSPSDFVVFGNQILPFTINLANLDSSQGAYITGTSSGNSGLSVSGAGDVNGDGYADVIIGAQGKAYILYGAETGFISSPTLRPTPYPTMSSSKEDNSGLSSGAIAGIVIGSMVGIFCLYAIASGNSGGNPPLLPTARAPLRKLGEIWGAFSSEATVLHKSQYDWIINHQKLLNLAEGKNLYITDILVQHTYSPYYHASELYEHLLKKNNLFYLILDKTSKLFLTDYNDYIVVFDKSIASSYSVSDKIIAVRSDINTTYINSKSIFMHEIIHMVFGDMTKNVSKEALAAVYETTAYSLLSHAAELMGIDEGGSELKILMSDLKETTPVDLFYLKSTIENTIQHKYDEPLVTYLADVLGADTHNEEELVTTYVPQVIIEYSLNAEEVYFLERMADYVNGVNSGVYSEGADGCEELAARCIEFRIAEISAEILELCRPIEDLMV